MVNDDSNLAGKPTSNGKSKPTEKAKLKENPPAEKKSKKQENVTFKQEQMLEKMESLKEIQQRRSHRALEHRLSGLIETEKKRRESRMHQSGVVRNRDMKSFALKASKSKVKTSVKKPKVISMKKPQVVKKPPSTAAKARRLEKRKLLEQKTTTRLLARGRLYAKAIFTGFRRGLRNQDDGVSLLKIEACQNKRHALFYVGKRCFYLYKCKRGGRNKHGIKKKTRLIWGKITRTHGNSGAVRAKFTKNLPPHAMAHRVRVMLYPSFI